MFLYQNCHAIDFMIRIKSIYFILFFLIFFLFSKGFCSSFSRIYAGRELSQWNTKKENSNMKGYILGYDSFGSLLYYGVDLQKTKTPTNRLQIFSHCKKKEGRIGLSLSFLESCFFSPFVGGGEKKWSNKKQTKNKNFILKQKGLWRYFCLGIRSIIPLEYFDIGCNIQLMPIIQGNINYTKIQKHPSYLISFISSSLKNNFHYECQLPFYLHGKQKNFDVGFIPYINGMVLQMKKKYLYITDFTENINEYGARIETGIRF